MQTETSTNWVYERQNAKEKIKRLNMWLNDIENIWRTSYLLHICVQQNWIIWWLTKMFCKLRINSADLLFTWDIWWCNHSKKIVFLNSLFMKKIYWFIISNVWSHFKSKKRWTHYFHLNLLLETLVILPTIYTNLVPDPLTILEIG